MSNTTRKALTLLIAVVVVGQMSVAPVAAQTTSTTTTTTDRTDSGARDLVDSANCAVRGTAGFYVGFLGLDVSQCDTPAEQVQQTRAATYAQGLGAYDLEQSATTNYQNQLNYSRNTCLCQVKAGVIESLQNNESIATAKSEANTTIDSHYAGIQHNIVQSHESQTSSLYYVHEALQSMGASGVAIYDTTDGGNGASAHSYEANDKFGVPDDDLYHGSKNVTLVDGNTTNYTVLLSGNADGNTPHWAMTPFGSASDGNYNYTDHSGVTQSDQNHDDGVFIITPGTTTHDMSGGYATSYTDETASYVYHEKDWQSVWTAVRDEHDYVQNNSMAYIDDVYNQYNASDFSDTDAKELQSACSLNTLASDKDTTGSLDWARAAATVAGYDTSVNTSWSITYTPAAGETWSGNTDITGNASGVTVSAPSIGDGAVIQGTEQYQVDIDPDNSTTVSNTTLVLEDGAGNEVGSVALTDANSDGRYVASMAGVSWPFLDGTTATVTPVVQYQADGTVTQVVMGGGGAWTYASDGGASVNLSGALYTDWAPSATNGTWETNTTYDTSNSGGESVVFLDSTQDGQPPGYYTLNGSFTVNELYDAAEGTEVNSTTNQDYNTQTFNASLTKDEVQRILEYREQYEDNWAPTIGGGGLSGVGGFLDGLSSALGVGGIVIVVIFALVFREYNV